MRDRSSRRGSYTLFMGVFAAGVIGFGALGVDISYLAMVNKQAQSIADAASHAALISYRNSESRYVDQRVDAGRAAAEYMASTNTLGLGETADLTDLSFGKYDPESKTFTANATPYNAARAEVSRKGSNPLDLILAPILGIEDATVQQFGVTAANPREVMVVVDRSCSMAYPKRSPGWEGVADSLVAFSTYMVNHQVPEDMLGVTSFNTRGDTWDPIRYIDGNESAIIRKWGTWGTCRTYRRRGREYTSGYACSGGTSQGTGIDPAINALVGTRNDVAFKAIIVISDGNPNNSSRLRGFLNATQRAWDNDIHVWTVSFGDNINHSLMEQATKGIGSYYSVPNADGLEGVMVDIAKSIPITIAD